MQKTAKTEVTTTSKPATKAVAKITPTVVKTVKVSRTKMSELLKANSGKFVSIVFVKQDGTVRTINGKASAKDYFTPLGYIKYKDSKNNYKLVDPRTTQELHCSGVIYKV